MLYIYFVFFVFFVSEQKTDVPPEKISDPKEVSFTREVFPIILKSCSTMDCHGNEQVPVLLTHKRISKYAKRIKDRITDEKDPMPPYSSGKKLTNEEIKTINRWINAGSPNN
jgi:uncharacterized membrane protein